LPKLYCVSIVATLTCLRQSNDLSKRKKRRGTRSGESRRCINAIGARQ
jgi:hypothetical protein